MKSSYRWVIVACGALMTCVGIGAMFSLAVYLQPMSVDTGWSRTGISSAMTLDFLVMGAAGLCRMVAAGPDGVTGATAARKAGRGFEPDAQRAANFIIGDRGVSIAAVHCAGGDLLPVLRSPFRADLPHGELCDRLRNSPPRRRLDLQCRGPIRPRRAAPARLAGRPFRRKTGAGGRPAGTGRCDRELSDGGPARRVLLACRGVRRRLRRSNAALCGSRC